MATLEWITEEKFSDFLGLIDYGMLSGFNGFYPTLPVLVFSPTTQDVQSDRWFASDALLFRTAVSGQILV